MSLLSNPIAKGTAVRVTFVQAGRQSAINAANTARRQAAKANEAAERITSGIRPGRLTAVFDVSPNVEELPNSYFDSSVRDASGRIIGDF